MKKNDGICEARNPLMMIMTETGYIGGTTTDESGCCIHTFTISGAGDRREDGAFVYI